jgi:hypothetical protein
MFSETDVCCVTIALVLYSIQEKNRRWIKEWYRRKRISQNTLENLKTDLVLSEPNDYKYFLCDSMVYHMTGYSRLQSLKKH